MGRALGVEGGVNSIGCEMSVCNVELTPVGKGIFEKAELVSAVVDRQASHVHAAGEAREDEIASSRRMSGSQRSSLIN